MDPFDAFRRYLVFGVEGAKKTAAEASIEQKIHFQREGWVKIENFLKADEAESLKKVRFECIDFTCSRKSLRCMCSPRALRTFIATTGRACHGRQNTTTISLFRIVLNRLSLLPLLLWFVVHMSFICAFHLDLPNTRNRVAIGTALASVLCYCGTSICGNYHAIINR